MDVIDVPRPSRKAINQDRAANALIMAQVSHLQHAERRLPLKERTEIYTHAIQTEGEAAEYIREGTEAIHKAHADVTKRRSRRGLEIAAAAERPKRHSAGKSRKKKSKPTKKKR